MTTASASSRVPRRDARENRQRLIQAASDVFGEHGTDVSLEVVAAEAGLGLATLYRRFPTKDELIAELVEAVLGHLVEVARRESAAEDGQGLERWLAEYADIQFRKRGFVARLWADPGTGELRAELDGLLAELLDAAHDAGRVRPELTVPDILLVVHALRGVALSTGYDEPQAWRRLLALLLAGLRPGAAGLNAAPWSPRPRK
ncbi:TetR/AcrR family transcriptional regulator [Trujillonella endophytica]|uniref:Transcriptional regulator, TetR family n=1 Tax=Trujillonella endophytica TaxID=673521 RepID=A0A1H8T3F4_9ACTN|nr:TetR/AcrR family transcriptional regulator [Trujillella endophytica]SEO85540.1 transcriptional regulator, TetR family [Trujillella endophytica]